MSPFPSFCFRGKAPEPFMKAVKRIVKKDLCVNYRKYMPQKAWSLLERYGEGFKTERQLAKGGRQFAPNL